MRELIQEMNRILRQWQLKYDVLGQTNFAFVMDKCQSISIQGISVPKLRRMDLAYASFDASNILLYFSPAHSLRISIDWPEDQAPTVSTVHGW